jgi:pyridinium-3,5-biscarboxylic acid mononucleotide sulfurtransferase
VDSLKAIITSCERVIVAFSGGVDSSFLLRVCVDVLGKNNVIAATGASETYTPAELEFAKNTAEEMNVRHLIIRTDEIGDEEFASNTRLRCYHCKKNFYYKLREKADAENIRFILDGTNSDDKNDYRPGRIAAAEYGILSPLMDAGITKDEIRLYSKSMNLKSWDRPANPCLASRVPYGSRITCEKLDMIARAEEFIRQMGFDTVRVRHHDTVARIEIPIRDMPRFMESSTMENTNRYMKSLGFTWITMDIGGYRTGSMNEIL